jgi:hypothetical protein
VPQGAEGPAAIFYIFSQRDTLSHSKPPPGLPPPGGLDAGFQSCTSTRRHLRLRWPSAAVTSPVCTETQTGLRWQVATVERGPRQQSILLRATLPSQKRQCVEVATWRDLQDHHPHETVDLRIGSNIASAL